MNKIFLIIFLIFLCSNTISFSIEIDGSKSRWTKVGEVKAGTVFKIHAEGEVNFGCIFDSCIDSATAGVEGNEYIKMFKDGLGLPWEDYKKNPIIFRLALIKLLLRKPKVNYDQGGVWIRITNKTGNKVLSTQLYYYWDKIYNLAGLVYEEDIIIWAKAHDGGRNPDSTESYGDNSGSYIVNLIIE